MSLWIPSGNKNFNEITLSRTISEINAFYAEIKDGLQKWQETDFWKKSPADSVDNPGSQKFRRNRSILHRFRDKCAFAFYAEIQDGYQKWRESDLCLKSPVDSSYTLQTEHFVEITLSCTVCFYISCRNSRFLKSRQHTLGVKHFDKIPLSHMVKEIEANLCFSIFGENSKWRSFWVGENFLKLAKSTLLRYPVGRKFRQNCSLARFRIDIFRFFAM